MHNDPEMIRDYRLVASSNWTVKWSHADSQPRSEGQQFALEEQRTLLNPPFHMAHTTTTYGAYSGAGINPNVLQSDAARRSSSPVSTEPSVPSTRGDEALDAASYPIFSSDSDYQIRQDA